MRSINFFYPFSAYYHKGFKMLLIAYYITILSYLSLLGFLIRYPITIFL